MVLKGAVKTAFYVTPCALAIGCTQRVIVRQDRDRNSFQKVRNASHETAIRNNRQRTNEKIVFSPILSLK